MFRLHCVSELSSPPGGLPRSLSGLICGPFLVLTPNMVYLYLTTTAKLIWLNVSHQGCHQIQCWTLRLSLPSPLGMIQDLQNALGETLVSQS